MKYEIEISERAQNELAKLKKNEPTAYAKANKLIFELAEHPETGTGKPERLTKNLSGKWSRRITDKHRLIYEIIEDRVHVTVLSAYGHYNDK